MLRKGICSAVLLWALAATAVQGAAEKSVLPPRPDNAAIDYLLAAAQLARARTEADLKAIEFIQNDFAKLPPAALKALPDAAEILRREASDVDIHSGAGKPRCQFDVDWGQGPEAPLSHLFPMRNLAGHAISIAKYLEFQDQPVEAAALYSDVARLSAHMAEEPMVLSGLVATIVEVRSARAIEGFLARDPPPEAIEYLADGLASLPEPAFPADRWILGEGKCFGDWFQQHPYGFVGLSAQRPHDRYQVLAYYFTNIERYTALAAELGKNPSVPRNLYFRSSEAVATAQAAVEEYREATRKFAALAADPYFKSGEPVTAMKAAITKSLDEMDSDPSKGNPFLLLMAECHEVYLRGNACEAQLGMLRIMVAAAKHKAETGAYPDTLEKLAGRFPKGLPKDPFTGRDFVYRLNNGLPAVECSAPESVLADTTVLGRWNSLDLGLRRQKDAQALEDFLAKPAPK